MTQKALEEGGNVSSLFAKPTCVHASSSRRGSSRWCVIHCTVSPVRCLVLSEVCFSGVLNGCLDFTTRIIFYLLKVWDFLCSFWSRHIFVGRRPSFQPQFLFAMTRFFFSFFLKAPRPLGVSAFVKILLIERVRWRFVFGLCLTVPVVL